MLDTPLTPTPGVKVPGGAVNQKIPRQPQGLPYNEIAGTAQGVPLGGKGKNSVQYGFRG